MSLNDPGAAKDIITFVAGELSADARAEVVEALPSIFPELAELAAAQALEVESVELEAREASHEEIQHATAVIDAIINTPLAQQYGVADRGDFMLLKTAIDGRPSLVVTYNHREHNSGVPIGSYQTIFGDKDDPNYVISVDGTRYDTREGMTEVVYRAMTDHIDKRVDPEQAKKGRTGAPEWTILTGEPTFVDEQYGTLRVKYARHSQADEKQDDDPVKIASLSVSSGDFPNKTGTDEPNYPLPQFRWAVVVADLSVEQ